MLSPLHSSRLREMSYVVRKLDLSSKDDLAANRKCFASSHESLIWPSFVQTSTKLLRKAKVQRVLLAVLCASWALFAVAARFGFVVPIVGYWWSIVPAILLETALLVLVGLALYNKSRSGWMSSIDKVFATDMSPEEARVIASDPRSLTLAVQESSSGYRWVSSHLLMWFCCISLYVLSQSAF